jgi:ribonuclease HI
MIGSCLVNPMKCLSNIDLTKKLLISLGFIINDEKSMLIPNNYCKFLGMIIDSNKLQLSLPSEKRQRIKSELENFITLHRCKIRMFAQLVGLLVSACPAIEYGWLYTKEMERCKYLNLKANHDNYDAFMNIPVSLLPDARWWLKTIDGVTHRIRDDTYCREVFSDASTTGWGAACNAETASGQWSSSEREYHINYLELLAAFIALKIFVKDLHNCQVLLRLDNTTAISYVNRMGGIQFPHLTEIARQMWQWCEVRKIFIFASYVRSKDNVIADAESRRNHPDIEWELSNQAFNSLTNKFGLPEVDLFASRINKKCEKYIAWNRDPDAMAINAFTLSWSSFYFYSFPPFSIILKTLRKIISDGARGIMVVPLWPTQPWFPLFTALLDSEMITFLPKDNVLLSHSSAPSRQIQSTLTLVAGILYGKRCQGEA